MIELTATMKPVLRLSSMRRGDYGNGMESRVVFELSDPAEEEAPGQSIGVEVAVPDGTREDPPLGEVEIAAWNRVKAILSRLSAQVEDRLFELKDR